MGNAISRGESLPRDQQPHAGLSKDTYTLSAGTSILTPGESPKPSTVPLSSQAETLQMPVDCYNVREELKTCIVSSNLLARFFLGDCKDIMRRFDECRVMERKVGQARSKLKRVAREQQIQDDKAQGKNPRDEIEKDPKAVFDVFRKIGPFANADRHNEAPEASKASQ